MEADALFQEALGHHRNDKFLQASDIYAQLYQDKSLFSNLSGPNQDALVLNHSALLRKLDKIDSAISVLLNSLTHTSSKVFNAGVCNNLGNCYLSKSDFLPAILYFRRSLVYEPLSVDARISLAHCLTKLSYSNLAYKILRDGLYLTEFPDQLRYLEPLAGSLIQLKTRFYSDEQSLLNFAAQLEANLPKVCKDRYSVEATIFSKFFLAQFYLGLGRLSDSLRYRDDLQDILVNQSLRNLSTKFIQNWNNLCWNLSIFLLKQGDLSNGWRLFDHGLQVPTDTQQKWQRALKKPFDVSAVPLWRGENLYGKSLLLLGEQGIGDSMMFLSLLPRLLREANHVSLFVEKRLRDIYARSFPSLSIATELSLSDTKNSASHFDYQCPLGSICKHRFTEISDYGFDSPILKSVPKWTSRFRNRHFDGRPLVGISWQGGGSKKVISQKSIILKQWKKLLAHPNFKFVSLQYGQDLPHIQKFKHDSGIDIAHDPDVDCTKDMDYWLSQVDAMDFVISVANTTIHGAAGLSKPTLCFLNLEFDWRWTDQSIFSGSYWYPTVDVVLQSPDKSWSDALSQASKWLDSKV